MPNKEQLDSNISRERALLYEEQFFNENEPWSIMKKNSDRFGISPLKLELSHHLVTLIEKSLPNMKKSTETALQEVKEQMDSLPPSVSGDAKIELLQTIRHFATLINYHINALQNLKVFNQKIKKQFDQFKDTIHGTKPKFVQNKPCQDTSPSASPSSLGSFWKRSEQPKESPVPKSNLLPNHYTLEDLKQIVNNQKGKELDGYSPYGAFEYLVKKSQLEWKSHIISLLNNICGELYALLTKVADDIFGRFPNLLGQIK